MSRMIVGVLRGGASSEYDFSLKTGAAMMSALPEERYETRDIFIDKNGFWHARGIAMPPARALSQVDVVLNALHGGAGEDGTVARLVERTGIPFVGSAPLASAMSLNKIRAREILTREGIRMPQALGFTAGMPHTNGNMAREVFAQFGPPYIVKPASEGSSHGIKIASNLAVLPNVLADVLDAHGAALVEEMMRGKEATVGVIKGFRGEQLYALPPARVLLPAGVRMLERQHRQEELVQHIVPSDFSSEEKKRLMEVARAAHQALGLGIFSQADFILTSRGPMRLEVDAIPGLYKGAAFPPMLESVGSGLPDFLEHSIRLATGRS